MAGPGAIPPGGIPGFNPRGGGQPPPASDPVKEVVSMATEQAKGAAKAIGTFRKHSVNSMQELALKGNKDPNVHRVVTNTITSPETGSLQMTYNGKAIAIAENSCTKMSKPKGGWFSGKKGTARVLIEEKVKKAKALSIKTYYGSKGPANAFLDASYGLSSASEAVFKARTGKELESSAKSGLNKAVDGILKLADKVTPDNASDVAKLAGTVQGLIEGTGAKVDEKKAKGLGDLIASIDEFDSAKGVAKQTSEELANAAKQSAEPTQYAQAA